MFVEDSETVAIVPMQNQQKEIQQMAVVEEGEEEPRVLGSTPYDRNDMDRMGKIQELKVSSLEDK